MPRTLLSDMIKHIEFENLPSSWTSPNLENFSNNKKLWDYQQSALKNAIKVLWKYYEDFIDYQDGERLEANQERKQKLFKWYKDNGLDEDLDIKLDKRKRDINNLLTTYYQEENGRISYKHFINRMSFWMATGSGKSLVIIKLIQILAQLIERKEIPPYDILVLTHRDDLIEQFKKHVSEFNKANEPRIILKELKEYPEVKRLSPTLFKNHEITVFYYRSDNLSDEQKEKIIDFKNYDNEGRWYVFLDEAHKGDKEESKRQHIYSILARNGFLFNFSATFTDPRDITTCAYEFNLSNFIRSGYGKHIILLKQEIRAFRDDRFWKCKKCNYVYEGEEAPSNCPHCREKKNKNNWEKIAEDYNNAEKQKIVLKSLILLTYIKKFYEEIKNIQSDLYHKPLLLVLVNSVNTEDADLKLFFRELVKIGKGKVKKRVFNRALSELWDELKQQPEFMFEENEKIVIDKESLENITKEDILRYVYNSESSGEIEISVRPSNKKELAFKLKTSNNPFALIKIGDISGWLKVELKKYAIQVSYKDESYFENLNREDSEINILMGSRGFYEGWDSNRPNVINFINIGTGKDAKKFILQSVGRGVRIEPIKNKKKRLLKLHNANEVDEDLFNKIKDKVLPVETLFIFGTNRNALITVIKELEKERKREKEHNLSLFVNEARKDKTLLVPIYKTAKDPIFRSNEQIKKFEISREDFELLKNFVEYIQDDRVFLVRYNTEPEKIKFLRESLEKERFKFIEKSFKNLDLLIQRYFDYLSVIPEDFEGLKELEEEIKHFKNIKVYLKEIDEIQKKIETVKDYPNREKELKQQYGKISPDEYTEKAQALRSEEDFENEHKRIKIKYIANHYYLPLILSDDEKIDYIKHIIKTKSEVKFINDLEKYLAKSDNKFKEFDWWMFSKLDESLDEIYIPYYDPNLNKISRFYPDFIFWLQKGDSYYIIFVDPKGTEHTYAYRKIDGYKELFEENGKERVFNQNKLKVRIRLLFRADDISKVPKEYKQYWFDNVERMLEVIL